MPPQGFQLPPPPKFLQLLILPPQGHMSRLNPVGDMFCMSCCTILSLSFLSFSFQLKTCTVLSSLLNLLRRTNTSFQAEWCITMTSYMSCMMSHYITQAYVFELDDEYAESDIPTTLIRSKADCPTMEVGF